MSVIPFAEWRPDMPSLSQWAREALNVVPAEESYRPLNGPLGRLQCAHRALPGRGLVPPRHRRRRYPHVRGRRDQTLSAVGHDMERCHAARRREGHHLDHQGQPRQGHGDVARLRQRRSGVFVPGVGAMTHVNGLLFSVTVVDANNFTIGVDTTGYSTYTSGGTAQKELFYSPGGDDTWRFTQFGPLAIAVNGVDVPQAFDLAVGTRWAALAGMPPIAAFVTTVRDFVLMD